MLPHANMITYAIAVATLGTDQDPRIKISQECDVEKERIG